MDHVIGRYGGLEKLEVTGNMKEMIRLLYADKNMRYVTVTPLTRISNWSRKVEPSANMTHLVASISKT